MLLRAAKPEEFYEIRSFYHNLIDKLQGRQNTIGWKKGIYPSDALILNSLENGELFAVDAENGYSACVVLNSSFNEGYIGCPWSIDCSPDEILVPHALAVNPDFQCKGLGSAVVRDIIEIAKNADKRTIRLDVLGGNTAAIRLYTNAGFRFVISKDMFYEDTGRTEYLMYELVL